MLRKSIVTGIVLLFLLSSLIPIASSYESNTGNTIYVDDDGTADYTRIQDAIDNASNNDTIFVYKGLYAENIFISKNIKLIGESKETTIIDGRGNKVIQTIYSGECNIRTCSIT